MIHVPITWNTGLRSRLIIVQYIKEEFCQLAFAVHAIVNERQMQITEEKVDTSKSLDASLVDTESSGTESKEQDTSDQGMMNMLMM
ncbi:hypothetical protein Tco_0845029 [Tanacetum coccineum]